MTATADQSIRRHGSSAQENPSTHPSIIPKRQDTRASGDRRVRLRNTAGRGGVQTARALPRSWRQLANNGGGGGCRQEVERYILANAYGRKAASLDRLVQNRAGQPDRTNHRQRARDEYPRNPTSIITGGHDAMADSANRMQNKGAASRSQDETQQ
jgi:hypothetical protein